MLRKECPAKPRRAHNVDNSKRKPIVHVKDFTKGVCNHLSKKLKCSHCGRNNHEVEYLLRFPSIKTSFFRSEQHVGCKNWRFGREVQEFCII